MFVPFYFCAKMTSSQFHRSYVIEKRNEQTKTLLCRTCTVVFANISGLPLHSSDTIMDNENGSENASSSQIDSDEEASPTLSNTNDTNDSSDNDSNEVTVSNLSERQGTISSARFNILSTMVGGGSLSLPLAFHQTGNGVLAPILLCIFAYLVQHSISCLIQAGICSNTTRTGTSSTPSYQSKGTLSYESITKIAYGSKASMASMALISLICYMTIIAYAVLLRDMLLPLSDYLLPSSSSNSEPTWNQNLVMLIVVVMITPLTTLESLTPLKNVGALSMMSLLTLESCIAYRSFQCNFSSEEDSTRHGSWLQYINVWPISIHELLDAVPILVSVYMCHFNVLTVHNELADPTPQKVQQVFSTSVWGACIFYILIGFIGSMYGNCVASGAVDGNILLSFEEDDGLLLGGRMCFSLTIACAFPLLVVPVRDIILRAWHDHDVMVAERRRLTLDNGGTITSTTGAGSSSGQIDVLDETIGHDLSEPLLTTEERNDAPEEVDTEEAPFDDGGDALNNQRHGSNKRRIFSSITLFWTAAMIACSVKSIDIVWDLLGGSLSLIMGFLLPSALYMKLSNGNNEDNVGVYPKASSHMASILIVIFIPVMIVSTVNAFYNVFHGD